MSDQALEVVSGMQPLSQAEQECARIVLKGAPVLLDCGDGPHERASLTGGSLEVLGWDRDGKLIVGWRFAESALKAE